MPMQPERGWRSGIPLCPDVLVTHRAAAQVKEKRRNRSRFLRSSIHGQKPKQQSPSATYLVRGHPVVGSEAANAFCCSGVSAALIFLM